MGDERASQGAITGIGQISLLIRDTDRATRFYEEALGLRHLYSFGDLVFFDCGGTRLYLHRVDDRDWRPGSILYLRVGDIVSAHRDLTERGVPFQGAPHLVHRHEDGVEEWMAFFEDTEGNTLALISQVRTAAGA
jgi:catechol 2,3-dioxygenase-like lactoylglutathione lyase family enzyme